MSCDPSYLSPMLVFEPDPHTAEAIRKSEKRYGIIALLCGMEPFLAVIFGGLVWGFSLDSMDSPTADITLMLIITRILDLFSLPCVIAGIACGITGRNTEGKFYATIGLWLSLLYCVLLFLLIVVGIFVYFIVSFSGGLSGSEGRCC